MNKLPLLLVLVAALALAGCTATDENADDDGASSNGGGGGSQVEGTMEVTDGTGASNETNPQTANSTNETGTN